MKDLYAIVLVFVVVLALTGCAFSIPGGLIYTHTITPLTTNFNNTPREVAWDDGEIKHLHVFIPNMVNVDVLWDSNAIGEIAKQNGFDKVYFADREDLSFLLGIWTRHIVHVYGR